MIEFRNIHIAHSDLNGTIFAIFEQMHHFRAFINFLIPCDVNINTNQLFIAIHFASFIARQQACIQIAAAIYTQARLRTSLFCFLLYQLSLWWVKYRAQPEAIST